MRSRASSPVIEGSADHPRTLGWAATSALAMGGSNQSLFLITALFAGQGDIPGQGSAAVPLLIIGLLLSWAAAPAWTELILMYPKRVGGIAATCAEAFRPYNPVLANLTGVCYWWGWIPTCGLTAIFSGAAIHEWYLPAVPVSVLAVALVALFTLANLCGVKWAGRLALPIATASAVLAFVSALAPVVAGTVDWKQAVDFHLTLPFSGWFGQVTGLMAGLYLIGFAAPAFEAAACHVGETKDPNRNVPRAMFASGLIASLYFIVLPVVWLGVLGPEELGKDLMLVLGPTFAPVFGSAAKAAAIWFMMFNMFHGTLQPLAGASRTLSQLAEDGLLPRIFEKRLRATDTPWVATVLTALMACFFLLLGDPIWLVAAANFTYLIGICLPNVAVWLLRRDEPDMPRPYRAPRGFITLGLVAAAVWMLSAILGFEQFGMKTVLIGVLFAYAGAALYAWRRFSDRRREGLPGIARTLHVKLTGAMLLVLALDGAGYFLAVTSLPNQSGALATVLEDIFVAVAMLTIGVGLVLPGIIAHGAIQVSQAARRMATHTISDISGALHALGRGNLDAALARVEVIPVRVSTRDEVGEMAESFNVLQRAIARAASSLDEAREELRLARHDALTGLITRREFERRLDSAMHPERSSKAFCMLFMDLDHFKVVNDTCGHAAGDELLRQIAIVLRQSVRMGDSVARLGGDEFALLLEDCALDQAERVTENLLKAIQDFSFHWAERVFRIGLSVGVVVAESSGPSSMEIMRAADAACYVAKKKGRNRFHVYEPADLEVRARQGEMDWLARCRSAMDAGKFCLYVQDVVPLSTSSDGCVHRELLLRMVGDDGELIEPMAFLPTAERFNLTGRIDRLVVSAALENCAALIAQGHYRAGSKWFINLSATSLDDDTFVTFVETEMAHHRVPFAAICFEITETAAITSLTRAMRFMTQLKVLGCSFSLDDFGSGMSSFAYLKQLPVDFLKIDGAFVRNIVDDPIDAAMVEAIHKVAHLMGIQTIAEYAESPGALVKLREIGVNFAQGYGVAQPVLFMHMRPVASREKA